MNIKQQLIDFLLKNGKPKSWKKTYDLYPFLGKDLNNKKKSDKVRGIYRTLMKSSLSKDIIISNKSILENCPTVQEILNEKKDMKDGLTLKSKWQNAAGVWLESYKVSEVESKKEEINYQEIINNLDYSIPKLPLQTTKPKNTTRLISITDIHLGMSSEGNIFNKEWCLKEYYKRLDEVIESIEIGEDIVLTVLGDFTDGLDGKTNRGKHKLPQNLNDEEMFEEGLKSLLYLLDRLSAKSNTVLTYFLTNSNHPGVTDHNISVAMENITPLRFSNCKWLTCKEFITPINVSGVDYLLTHGYDSKLMSRNTPRFYSDKEINKFRSIVDYYKLDKPTILRGDLHQFTHVDYDHFQDLLVPAFSSPSGWIAINFFSQNNGGFVTATYQDSVPSYTFHKFK